MAIREVWVGTPLSIIDTARVHGRRFQAPNVTGCDSPDRCGFRLDHNLSVYTSWDLSSGSWAFQGYAFPWTERPAGTLFRPSAVFNPTTHEYILWWNYVYPNGTYAGFAVATSSKPQGPFEQRRAQVNIAHLPAGDFHLFVDDDGTGYVLYSADFWITIEELTPDFLGVSGRAFDGFRGNRSEWGFEAPVMFKRKGIYYILFGPMCCFCYQGSGIRVYTATSPLGTYTFQGDDIACASKGTLAATAHTRADNDGPIPTPEQGCLFYGTDQISTTRAQQNFVVEVQTSGGETEYVWTGDRWMQSPDGLKGHEPQYWFPLSFDEQGRIERVSWIDLFVLDVADMTEEDEALPLRVSQS